MMFESLEGRRLLSGVVVTALGDTVIYQLPDSGAALHVIEIPVGTGATPTVFAVDASGQLPGVYSGINHIIIQGGAGNDIIHYSGDTVGATITGGAGNDTIVVDASNGAASPACFIDGGDGNDFIVVTGGTGDTIFGGNGDDTLASGGGIDQLIDGGNGKDSILSLDISSTVTGGNGKDFLAVLSADSTLPSNGTDRVVVVVFDPMTGAAVDPQAAAIVSQVQAVLNSPSITLF
ncbi:MAG: hypothetical protein JWO87_1405 [Phycisphaerales bacterium]|nr:hypothetical protein [Phycisphaerales bacterium]